MTGERRPASRRPTALVVRALGLGDFLTGLPALRLLRTQLPRHRLVLATPSWWSPLVELANRVDDGLVDALVHGHELAPLVDAPRRPDLAVDLHGNGVASRDLLAATKPARLLAFADGPARWVAEEHEVARWVRFVRESLPAPHAAAPSLAGVLGPPPAGGAPAGRTVVHCGAAAPSRRWPADRFAEVARSLAAAGHDVVVTAGTAEAAIAGAIAAAAGAAVLVQPPLTQLCELVGRARLVIAGDTGVAHLASVYATPSVVLFGPVSPALWGPPADPRHQVLAHGAGSGDPHGAQVDPALLRVQVGEVVAAAGRAQAADARRAG